MHNVACKTLCLVNNLGDGIQSSPENICTITLQLFALWALIVMGVRVVLMALMFPQDT